MLSNHKSKPKSLKITKRRRILTIEQQRMQGKVPGRRLREAGLLKMARREDESTNNSRERERV